MISDTSRTTAKRNHCLCGHQLRICDEGTARDQPQKGDRHRMADLLPWWKRFFGYLFDVIPKGKIPSRQQPCFENWYPAGESPACAERDGGQSGDPLHRRYHEVPQRGSPLPRPLPCVHGEQIRVSEPLVPVEKNIIIGNAPLFHILGQTCSLAILLVGGTLMLQPKVNVDATFDAIRAIQSHDHDRRADSLPDDAGARPDSTSTT